MEKQESDLFGGIPYGSWTDLDRIRKQVQRLQKKVDSGADDEGEYELLWELRGELRSKEKEASERWKTSFKS